MASAIKEIPHLIAANRDEILRSKDPKQMIELVLELSAAVKARESARQLRAIRAGKPLKPATAEPADKPTNEPTTNSEPTWKRMPPSKSLSIKQRITARADVSAAAIRDLQIQARVLIADPLELKATLAELRRLSRTFRRHATAQHQAHDLPRGRPAEAEQQFRAACQRIMKAHAIGPTDAATIIVRHVAPLLPDAVRTDLLGPWQGEREQVEHLRDVLRKPL